MKAWILENQAPVEKTPLALKELPNPHPKANEIRIKNVACGVCSTDIHVAEGDLVPFALSQLDSGGKLVLGPVTMSPIKIKDYNLIWQERSIISLAHISRKDGVEFLQIANDINIKTSINVFSFDDLPEVLIQVKHGEVNGNAVIEIK